MKPFASSHIDTTSPHAYPMYGVDVVKSHVRGISIENGKKKGDNYEFGFHTSKLPTIKAIIKN